MGENHDGERVYAVPDHSDVCRVVQNSYFGPNKLAELNPVDAAPRRDAYEEHLVQKGRRQDPTPRRRQQPSPSAALPNDGGDTSSARINTTYVFGVPTASSRRDDAYTEPTAGASRHQYPSGAKTDDDKTYSYTYVVMLPPPYPYSSPAYNNNNSRGYNNEEDSGSGRSHDYYGYTYSYQPQGVKNDESPAAHRGTAGTTTTNSYYMTRRARPAPMSYSYGETRKQEQKLEFRFKEPAVMVDDDEGSSDSARRRRAYLRHLRDR